MSDNEILILGIIILFLIYMNYTKCNNNNSFNVGGQLDMCGYAKSHLSRFEGLRGKKWEYYQLQRKYLCNERYNTQGVTDFATRREMMRLNEECKCIYAGDCDSCNSYTETPGSKFGLHRAFLKEHIYQRPVNAEMGSAHGLSL